MLNRFISTLRSEHLLDSPLMVLAAVSGGRDSVTLVHLLDAAHIPFAIAHCNFHLRPGDCDRDEAFVRQLAINYQVPCFVAQFNTEEYAAHHHLSIEVAARQQRYTFFSEILQGLHSPTTTSSTPFTNHNSLITNHNFIATAHHRDDAIETFFINLLRGTGVRGLRGIPFRNGNIIRPLLSFGRDEIDRYVADNNLPFVEDYTNSQPIYLRNRIRHQLLPLLRQLSPSFDDTMQHNMQHISSAELLMRSAIDHYRQQLLYPCQPISAGKQTNPPITNQAIKQSNNSQFSIHQSPITNHNSQFTIHNSQFTISIPQLLSTPDPKAILFELLHPYGFNSSQIDDIFASFNLPSGPKFFSPSHILYKDRDNLLLQPLHNSTIQQSYHCQPISVGKQTNSQFTIHNSQFTISTVTNHQSPIKLSKSQAAFDFDTLHFPLSLRRWRAADRFRPFGLKGSKLVSDLFTDLKLNAIQKQNAWLLCDADDRILWVVGYRASALNPVTTNTKTILFLKIQNPDP